MELPEWLRSLATKVAHGAKLIPSEQDTLRAKKTAHEQRRTDTYDRKTSLEEEVRRLEARLLKLDAKRRSEHGVLQRATVREMQAAGVQLKSKETQLHQAISDIADLDLIIGQIEHLLTGRPIRAEDWDEVGLDREQQLTEEAEVAQAREQVQGLREREPRDLEGEVDLEALMGEIRGAPAEPDPATKEMIRNLKERQPEQPE